MNCYTSLAGGYDSLTEDVQYEKRAAFLQKLLAKSTIPVHTVLDLACGTGTMTCLLAEAGYEMIGVDISEDMLSEAAGKTVSPGKIPPIYLQQSMEELDLYGTVEAAVCCLDSINYLTDARALKRALQRLHLFVAPGGVFLFDVNTPCKLRSLDGQVFLDEREDLYCVWRAEFDRRSRICTYGMDIFERQGALWRRSLEEHYEKAWEVEELKRFLTEAGFGRIRTWGDCRLRAPRQDEQRIYFSCIRE
ncbi:class I SAM-dependent methyltransferase [bacterium 210917-SL.2.15]|nr:class I SAM-dependent methyltransferase [bacterium 210917-SL.2.15]